MKARSPVGGQGAGLALGGILPELDDEGREGKTITAQFRPTRNLARNPKLYDIGLVPTPDREQRSIGLSNGGAVGMRNKRTRDS